METKAKIQKIIENPQSLINQSLYNGPTTYGAGEKRRIGPSNLEGYNSWLEKRIELDFWSDDYNSLGEETQTALCQAFEVDKERKAFNLAYRGYLA